MAANLIKSLMNHILKRRKQQQQQEEEIITAKKVIMLYIEWLTLSFWDLRP